MKLPKLLFLVGLVVGTSSANAYELETHAAMTQRAYARSLLGASDGQLIGRLGLQPNYDLGDAYFDMNGFAAAPYRFVTNFEKEVIKSGTGLEQDQKLLNGWLMRGAVREDDGGFVAGWRKGEPLDDPYGNFNRFCSHFFDPFNDSAFTRFCGLESIVEKAPNWAIGTIDAFASPVQPAAGYRNHFTVFAARETMWRALTLRDGQGAAVFGATGPNQEAIRKAYWATTFRTLGDVVHILEDMAQPQHTRNEGHFLSNTGYEEHINTRATRATLTKVNNTTGVTETITPVALNYDGYPIPRFNSYTDFWATAHGGPQGGAKGLANYTNTQFFTVGTSIGAGNFDYPSPTREVAAYQQTTEPLCGNSGGVNSRYLVGAVNDFASGGTDVIRLQSRSIWHDASVQSAQGDRFTINPCVMDDYANLLIPRAVAYSAGLIDYFFRGKLTISPPDEGVYGIVDHSVEKSITTTPPEGFRKIKLKVKNSTDAINGIAQHMTGGNLIAVVKFHRNTCYTEDLSGEWGAPDASGNAKGDIVFQAPEQGGCRTKDEEIVVSDIQSGVSLPAGGVDQPYEFRFATPIPINATDVYLQVVYRGNLGSESDAVAVETRDIGEPSFTAYTNGNDYLFCYNGDWHYRGPNGEFPPELENVVTDYGRYAPAPLTDVKIAYEPYELTPSVNTLVQTAAIAPKTYIRYAALHEVNGNWGISVTSNNSERILWHNLRAIDPGLLINQINYAYDAGTNTLTVDPKARKMTKVRKHYTAYGLFYHFAEGAACSGPYPPDIYDAPALAPVTINGAFGQP